MVAQFFGLKVRLLGNLFRRSRWQLVGTIIGLVYGLGFAVFLGIALIALRFVDTVEPVRDILVIAGSLVVLGFVVLPLLFGVDDTMDPRSFALFGMPNRTLSLGLGLSALISIPSLCLAIVLLGFIVTWSRGFGATVLALVAAALALATCVLLARLATSLASLLLATRRAREFTGVFGLLALVAISPIAILLGALDWDESGAALMSGIADILSWTPLGAVWAVPGDAASGAWGAALLKLLIAAGTLWLLWLAWQALVGRMLVTPGREAPSKAYHGIGWFDRLPHNPSGAIAARSITYWTRDARYWVSLVMIPVLPAILMLSLSVGGVGDAYLALLPVPVMSLFLGWTIHNDVAYDSTAIWLHVSSGTRGLSDRIGRLVPALVLGVLLIGLGTGVSMLLHKDWSAMPALLGVSTCLFLGGLGFGSYTSARFPYPVPKPGDSAFAQPQSSGTAAALVQAVTLFGTVLLAAPALGFAVLGFTTDPEWHVASLIAGCGLGVLALVGGVWAGSRTFERRGPELLAAALRA
jgi:ABC-2 type transport system permease protein